MDSEYGIPYDANLQKVIQDSCDVSQYDYLPEKPRLYYKSHIFGGVHQRDLRWSNLFIAEENKIIRKQITTPKLLERLFLEILSNALDNVYKSRRMGIDPSHIEITMTGDTFSVKNFGIPIPVGLHKYFTKQGIIGTAAELIFGVIGAGSNTSESVIKQGGGQNGYGAKLTNIFSREFIVKICDSIRGFQQTCIWRRNMMDDPIVQITPNYTLQDNWIQDQDLYGRVSTINVPIMIPDEQNRYRGPNSVEISAKIDFRKMGCQGFDQNDLQLFMRFAVEATFHSKIPVIFNGVKFDFRNVNDFNKIFNANPVNTPIIHYEWPNGISPQCIGKQLDNYVATGQLTPEIELVIIDTPDSGQHISYCNGIYNIKGGSHTNVAYQEVLKVIKDVISSNKGFEKSGLDLSKIDIGDLKKHLTIIINFKCNEPSFKGQDKELLQSPTPKINIPIEAAAKIKKWKVVDRIYTTLTGKHIKVSDTKTTGGRIKDDWNFEEANWVGTSKSPECVLITVEGKSAGSSVLNWILATDERKNKYAILPVQGKLKNITDLSVLEVEQCKEIMTFIKYSGLKYGVDYTTREAQCRMKYGYFYGMTDADSDGSHIQSLYFNVIYRLFPSLFIANRVFYVPTPVIRIINSKGDTDKICYNMTDYEEYIKTHKVSSKKVKYFKGLASRNKKFVQEEAKIGPIVCAYFDQQAAQSLDIAFKKGLTTQRKQWLAFWRDKIDQNIIHQLQQGSRFVAAEISMYINTKLVEYSIDSFSRALPSFKDGLKLSQRQLIWYLLEEYNYGGSSKNEAKIGELAQGASMKCKYHHGDLTKTLARLGCDYPGSNNLPIIAQEGSFGTRNKLGADAGADRYVETKTLEIVSLIFKKELTNLIEQLIVQDHKVQPKWLPSLIPLHVINGVLGIATAYSTEIHSYHPIDVIDWITCYITGNNPFPMIPWFMGFTGEVSMEIFKGKFTKEEKFIMQGQEQIPYYEGLTLTTKGIYRAIGQRQTSVEKEINGKKQYVAVNGYDIEILEIPIGIATSKFRFEMEKNCDKVHDEMKDTDSVHMFLLGWNKDLNEKELGMIKRSGMTNITLIDDDSFPVQLRNVYEVLKLYCDNMNDLFVKLKEKRLFDLSQEIINEQKTIKLMELILSKNLIYEDQEDYYITQQLAQHGIEFEFFEKLGFKSIKKNGLEKHRNTYAKLLEKYNLIQNTHYLEEWLSGLRELRNIFLADPKYQKYQHHIYPYVYTPINSLLDGSVKSPYKLKEEVLPLSI